MNVYCFATIREIVAGAIWVGEGSGYVLSGWGKIVEIGGSNPNIRISDYPDSRLNKGHPENFHVRCLQPLHIYMRQLLTSPTYV